MGIAERKVRKHNATRKLILGTALDLYLQEGLENTTIRKIAQKIEYSPTAIYLHYQSKNGILYDMQKIAFDFLFKYLSANQVQESPYLRLKKFGKAYIDFGLKYPKYYDLMFILRSPMEGVQEDQPFKNCRETYAFMLGIMTDCISTGEVKYTDPQTALLQYWAILHGLTSLNINNRLSVIATDEWQTTDFIYQAWEVYISSVQA
ncbi:TetR/AcrR family transcriptional regulator [Dyadobacter chenwenxiniae]|uniref:TetR/AcrR family transcriptional regulator n=1 Tax=Dyadobacter chenwenxiniae TaxID=2906456 RepID=A0A9X1TDI4_9BACT|nr:TetR/AcrR family transcriptional regulator [Dyadobacter chenwenxiniae]MCF0060714.1 TetR/AcrR family transcriptional regulator [Dyadobacter chenwenxiniae]UON80548.1 TetR/AcrR family transcriptional regulator [Dyadobacter chenwenxiniae]